jgi:ABC-type transporter Mla subunit MlaD
VIDLNAMLQAKSDALDALIAEGREAVAKFNATMDNVNGQITALAPTIAALPKLVADLDTAINNFKVKIL